MYATLQDLVNKYGTNELAELLCDEQQFVTSSLLTAHLGGDVSQWSQPEQDAIARAALRAESSLRNQSDFIDAALGSRYHLPLLNPNYGALVDCCLALTRADLSDDGDNITTTVKEERDYWRKWLDRIADGKNSLPGEQTDAAAASVGQHHVGKLPSSVQWESY